MLEFVQRFLARNPRFQKNNFFIFAESYGGHYAPAVAHAIWSSNKRKMKGKKTAPSQPVTHHRDVVVNLQGVGIGNGMTDVTEQLLHYADMAISTNGHDPAVSTMTYYGMQAAAKVCHALSVACNKGSSPSSSSSSSSAKTLSSSSSSSLLSFESLIGAASNAACVSASQCISTTQLLPFMLSGRNQYDMRIPCEVPGLCYNFT